jgi:hypothetical protein
MGYHQDITAAALCCSSHTGMFISSADSAHSVPARCCSCRRGWLDAEQLRCLLTACEDALTEDEANAMIDAAADNQGRLNYQEYALRLATDGREID